MMGVEKRKRKYTTGFSLRLFSAIDLTSNVRACSCQNDVELVSSRSVDRKRKISSSGGKLLMAK
jgi:hypothetical protein